MPRLADINLNRLVVFVAVVDSGTLTAAARRLGLTKTMVSTHIQRLEAEVGASLLLRTTRRLTLTDAGKTFFDASRRILRDAEAAVSAAAEETAEPRGNLRITAPPEVATIIASVAGALSIRYRGLKIDLVITERVLNLVDEGIDLAIRLGALQDSSQRAFRIGDFGKWLIASPSVLAHGDPPRTPSDLAGRPFIALSALARPLTWTFDGPGGVRQSVRFEAALTASISSAVRAAALAGAGFAVLPDTLASDDVASGRLVRVLPAWTLPRAGIYAVFPSSQQRPRKARLFIDALRGATGSPWMPAART